MRPRAGATTLLVLIAVLAPSAAACAGPAPTTSIAAATPTPASATPTAAATPAPPSPAASGASPVAGAVEDAALITILPAAVDGIPVTVEHAAFVDAVADPDFARHVQRAVFGVAVSGTDLVSGVVAELGEGLYSDAFFRDWRDSYNEGACGQASGVIGNAEAEIGGRTVYIASCAGGLRTYHAWLPERGTIVSVFALGERRLGERLMEGLRP